jgi:hypothetical protein
MLNTINESNVLKEFKITPTENRAIVLVHIFFFTSAESFSAGEVIGSVFEAQLSITKASITNILRLFCVRGLILTMPSKKTLMRGRPQARYGVSPKTLSLIKFKQPSIRIV